MVYCICSEFYGMKNTFLNFSFSRQIKTFFFKAIIFMLLYFVNVNSHPYGVWSYLSLPESCNNTVVNYIFVWFKIFADNSLNIFSKYDGTIHITLIIYVAWGFLIFLVWVKIRKIMKIKQTVVTHQSNFRSHKSISHLPNIFQTLTS